MNSIHQFIQDNNIQLYNICIQKDNDNSFAIHAKSNIYINDTVVKIPKECILSIKNTAIADIIEEHEIGGTLALSLALMYEKLQGESSPWFDYISCMPSKTYIPLLWNKEELSYLSGTDLGYSIHRDFEMLKLDYETFITPILLEYPFLFPPEKVSFDLFLSCASLVSSRAFMIDEYHEEALVPVADL